MGKTHGKHAGMRTVVILWHTGRDGDMTTTLHPPDYY